jgi:hypothetical protein
MSGCRIGGFVTSDELEILKASEDRILAVELVSGEQFFAEIVMVVDEPPTPDVFLLKVLREPDGAFVAASEEPGESILLEEIARVARIPGVDY